MSILVTPKTRVLVQGMTGREGRRATKEMLDYGTTVSCGVTPGKAGEKVENLPVFDNVREAKAFDPALNTSVIYVPPLMVLDAALEAMENGIELIVVITENVPIKDAAKMFAYAQRYCCRIIGPTSIGIILPGQAKIGSIGGPQEKNMYTPGNIGVISKSGSMSSETSRLLSVAGLGQSTVIGIGGDVIAGSTFTDLLELFEQDEETDAVVLFAEIGGAYEELVAEFIKAKKFTKPVVAYVSGTFAETMSQGVALGHAGAIVEAGYGSAREKKRILQEAGVIVATYHHEIPDLVKKALEK